MLPRIVQCILWDTRVPNLIVLVVLGWVPGYSERIYPMKDTLAKLPPIGGMIWIIYLVDPKLWLWYAHCAGSVYWSYRFMSGNMSHYSGYTAHTPHELDHTDHEGICAEISRSYDGNDLYDRYDLYDLYDLSEVWKVPSCRKFTCHEYSQCYTYRKYHCCTKYHITICFFFLFWVCLLTQGVLVNDFVGCFCFCWSMLLRLEWLHRTFFCFFLVERSSRRRVLCDDDGGGDDDDNDDNDDCKGFGVQGALLSTRFYWGAYIEWCTAIGWVLYASFPAWLPFRNCPVTILAFWRRMYQVCTGCAFVVGRSVCVCVFRRAEILVLLLL